MRWFDRMPGVENDNGHIRGFFEEYRWMSNFHECDVMWKGLRFSSSEAAYQAAKSNDPKVWLLFTQMGPSQAKKEGRKLDIREDWETVRVGIMYDILQDKFLRNPELADKLKATGDKHLEETNWWGDTFWGVCKGKGENTLGILLMAIRKQLYSDNYDKLRKSLQEDEGRRTGQAGTTT
jgi:ribA/ribD-fused uncharacterized protein